MLELKGGRVEALVVLFERSQRLIFDVAKRILRDSAEAEDLTKDIFIEIYRQICAVCPAFHPNVFSVQNRYC